MNSRLLELKFQLENCDWITIPGKYIGSFCVTDIKKCISRQASNYIGEYDVAESIIIEIHKDANTFHKQFGEIQNYGHTKFKRLMEWNDITGIEFSGKKNVQAIDAYNNVLGTRIVMEVETAPDGEYFED